MRRAWGLVAIVAAVVVMAAVLVPFEPYIARYSPAEDDLPAIVHSASPYVQLRDFPTWFGSGYAGYFDNYPGWPRVGSDFVRPVQNVALFAMSLLVPALGLRAYLLADYLCLAISVVLMVQLLRRYTGVSPAVAGITAVAFGLSSVFLLSLLYGSFGTNTFALALTLASLVVLHPSETNEISGRRMLACAALQTLAVMSHETAVVGPLVAYFLIRAVSSGPPRLRRVGLLGLPFVAFVIERLGRGVAGTYVVQNGLSGFIGSLKYFLMHPLFPYEPSPAWTVLFVEHDFLSASGVIYLLALITNLALLGAIAWSSVRRHERQRLWMLAAVGAAMLPTLIAPTEPRFAGLGFAVGLVAVFSLLDDEKRVRVAVVALVLLASLALYTKDVIHAAPREIARTSTAQRWLTYLHDNIAKYHPDSVIMVNDMTGVGGFGASSAVAFAAWPTSSPQAIVVDSFSGAPSRDSRSSITVKGNVIEVRDDLADSEVVDFWGNQPDFGKPTAHFRYARRGSGPIHSFSAIGLLPTGRTLIVGFDPATGGLIAPRIYVR